jgi:two-component system response regulator NreC
MHDNEPFFFQALQAGGDGYVTKAAPEWELLSAIRSVYQGQCYLNASVTKLLVSDYLERAKRGDRRTPYDLLTDREREILHLVAAGHSNREIAEILGISEHTVHNHRAHLMEKLGVHNRLELLKYAMREGIITADA